MSITLKITFLSDWHIGEGAGASGHIDRVVRRHSEDGLPYVPAKTLTGILRDACEKVAHGLDGEDNGTWQRFVAALFGEQSKGAYNIATTTPALVAIGPARLAPSLRAALRDQTELKAALTFVKPGVKLDENGIVESKMLRFDEVVMAGVELEAALELDAKVAPDETAHAVAVAMLAAGARAVERLGAKRRRGNGRCCIELVGHAPNFDTTLAADPPSLDAKPDAALHLAPTAHSGKESGWHVIPLDLELLSPVVIPADSAGNVIASRDHIPGSLLLPALDKKLRALLGDEAGELTSHLASGRIQIRNANPLKDGQRLLPVPASLMAEKEAPDKITNELCGNANDGIQRKQLRSGYVPASGLPRTDDAISPLFTVKTIATTHAVIDDPVQRPTADVGGVYTYEAIAPGQIFRSEIWIAQSVLTSVPDPGQLNGKLRIGRAKKDDYGLVMASTGKVGAGETVRQDGNAFTLWLVSSLLARDERMRPITDAHALASWLGKQLGNITLTPKTTFARSFRDDGWNTAWKEPRPTRFGLAAGSCFIFSSSESIPADKLAALEMAGLGERCGEGYGEIRINPALLANSGLPLHDAPKEDNAPPTPDPITPTDFIRHLHERAWRIVIRRQAVAKAASIAMELGWTETKLANSQLGALRSLFEQWAGPERLKTWLDHLNKTDNRRNKWPAKSLTILAQVSSKADDVWTRLETDDLPVLAGMRRETLKQSLTAEATRILWLTVIGGELDRLAEAEKNKEGN